MSEIISIIVPVYNGEKYLEETVQRLLESEYQEIEVVLINDGSTDNSSDICENLKKCDSRIKVYHQNNQGIVAARNVGLEIAKGNYICFCDQDDIVQKSTYKKMYNAIKESGADLCICSTGKYIEGSIIPFEIYDNSLLDKNDILTNIVFPILFDGYKLAKVKVSNRRAAGTIWKCMIKKKLIVDASLKFKKIINFEDDLLFLFDCLSRCEKVITLNYIGYYWRINSDSETYRWKYIEDLFNKENVYYSYIENILKKFKVKSYIHNEYRQFFLCTLVVELIDNEGSPQNIKKTQEKIDYLKEKIVVAGLNKKLSGSRNIEWGLLRKKVILILIKMRMIKCAYFFNIVYRNVKVIGVKSSLWSKMERIIRRK